MAKLILMVGLPASGKSSLAQELAIKYDAVVLSSDKIREQLYGDESIQGDANKVFETLHYQVNSYLIKGANVVLDSTNINRKRRIHLIKNEIKADEYICYYMNAELGNCIYHDEKRERTVGYEVIDRMYKTLQIPLKKEGWDKVIIYNKSQPLHKSLKDYFEEVVNSDSDHDFLFEKLGLLFNEFDEITDLPHDSKYHTFSVSRHIYHTYKYVFDNYTGNRKFEMLVASLFHDVGKGYCKSFYNHKGEESKFAHYYGHEFVSAQIVMNELYHLGYDYEFIKYVSLLVELHMLPKNLTEKTNNKLKKLLTQEEYDDLMFLHLADTEAK